MLQEEGSVVCHQHAKVIRPPTSLLSQSRGGGGCCSQSQSNKLVIYLSMQNERRHIVTVKHEVMVSNHSLKGSWQGQAVRLTESREWGVAFQGHSGFSSLGSPLNPAGTMTCISPWWFISCLHKMPSTLWPRYVHKTHDYWYGDNGGSKKDGEDGFGILSMLH